MSKRDTRRVKVYKLQESGDWHDVGTGHVECIVIDKLDAPCIVVKSEDDETVILLQSKISGEDIYNKQQDTLIVWNEPDPDDEDEGSDLALSFQDKEGCAEIWEELCDIQQTLKSPGEGFLDLECLFKLKDPEEYLTRTVTLPPANLGHIDEIHTLLTDALTVGQKQSIATAMSKEQYVQKLVDLWKIVDDLSSEEDYVKMYHIFKDLILLNSIPLIEQVVNPRFVIEVMAALEHDPERHIGAMKHSDFLRNQATFKEVVPLNDSQLQNKIHQTFRLQYLKDVALARTLDEPTFATINSLIFVNNIQIITDLASNEEIMAALFTKMKSPATTQQELKEQLCFLHEMCDLGKNLEPKNKILFYQLLHKNGLLEVLEQSIVGNDVKLRMTSAELLLNFVEHDAGLLRTQLIKQPDYALFSVITTRLDADPETGVKNLLTDVVRHLCDVTNIEEGMEKLTFLNLFYQRHTHTLFSPLMRPLPKNLHSEAEALLKNNLCDLLSSFLQHHGQYISTFLTNNNLVKTLLNLLNCKEKWLVLSAIRFFRMFISVDNTQYKNYIISENLFEPIVLVFLKNGPKYNLLNSAVLELFDLILKKNMTTIIKHIMENHYEKLKDIKYVDVFQRLKEQFEKNEYAPPTPEQAPDTSAIAFSETTRIRLRTKFLEEKKEEDWFDADEGDDEDYNPSTDPDADGDGDADSIPFTTLQEFKERSKKRGRLDQEADEDGDSDDDGTGSGRESSSSKKLRKSNGKTEKLKEKNREKLKEKSKERT